MQSEEKVLSDMAFRTRFQWSIYRIFSALRTYYKGKDIVKLTEFMKGPKIKNLNIIEIFQDFISQ